MIEIVVIISNQSKKQFEFADIHKQKPKNVSDNKETERRKSCGNRIHNTQQNILIYFIQC